MRHRTASPHEESRASSVKQKLHWGLWGQRAAQGGDGHKQWPQDQHTQSPSVEWTLQSARWAVSQPGLQPQLASPPPRAPTGWS